MKVLELVQSARAEDEAVFDGTPDNRSAKIVAAALRDLGRRLEETDEGRVAIPGLGSFVVREAEAGERDKRIVFRPAAGRKPAGRKPAGRNPGGRNPAGRASAGRKPAGRNPRRTRVRRT